MRLNPCQSSPAATIQVSPSGEVTIIVKVLPFCEESTSIKPPFSATPIATGFSEYSFDRYWRIVLRCSHCCVSIGRALLANPGTDSKKIMEDRIKNFITL